MGISEETRLTNFLINVLRRRQYLKKALIEFTFKNSDNYFVKPDLFVYLIEDSDPRNYMLFEFKKRESIDVKKIDEIKMQYEKYCKLENSSLDSTIIPTPPGIPIFINYVFYNTPDSNIQEVSDGITFRNQDVILSYLTQGDQSRILQINKDTDNILNKKMIEFLLSNSKRRRMWERNLLLFTLKDLEGIKFLSERKGRIKVKPEVSCSIIVSHLFTFIRQRKIRDLNSNFDVEEFFEHLFSSLKGIIIFGNEDKTAMIRKLNLFLIFLSEICIKEKLKLIKKSETEDFKFLIILKKTHNFASRMAKIEDALQKEVKKRQLQREITDFIHS